MGAPNDAFGPKAQNLGRQNAASRARPEKIQITACIVKLKCDDRTRTAERPIEKVTVTEKE